MLCTQQTQHSSRSWTSNRRQSFTVIDGNWFHGALYGTQKEAELLPARGIELRVVYDEYYSRAVQ